MKVVGHQLILAGCTEMLYHIVAFKNLCALTVQDRGQERRLSSKSKLYQRQHDDFRDIGSNEWLSGHGGSAASPVVQLVRKRLAEGSTPNFRTPGDTAKLGLVVEGAFDII